MLVSQIDKVERPELFQSVQNYQAKDLRDSKTQIENLCTRSLAHRL